MIARRQLPVASPVDVAGLLRATSALVSSSARARDDVTQTLTREFRARAVALTDSGTSALSLALRIAVGRGHTVAFPAYACVDLIAAARFEGVMVRLYDVDPHTLSPDLDSVRRVLAEGAAAIVVVHLYGFPADVEGVRTIAQTTETVVIEDAAQQAGATLHGQRAGSLGDIAILSFGRGKGTTAGNGGALLALTDRWTAPVRTADPAHETSAFPRGTRDLIGAAASWALGRPSVYEIPSSIPALHLGETIYHDAHEPQPMSQAGTALLRTTLRNAHAMTTLRQQHAAVLQRAAEHSQVQSPSVIAGGTSGYLRFPVIAPATVGPYPQLGIVRGYPRPLSDQPELSPLLHQPRESLAGARQLAQSLLTLPTHHYVTHNDLGRLTAWLSRA